MKNDFKPWIEEEPSAQHDRIVRNRAAAVLESRRHGARRWRVYSVPALVAAGTAMIALVLFYPKQGAMPGPTEASFLAYDPAMLEEADLLLELENLEKLEAMKTKKGNS